MQETDQQTQDKINRLSQQISQAALAEQLHNHEVGRLIPELLTEEITLLTREITSDKFLKDHTGYVNKLAELQANKKLLRKLQLLTNPSRTAKLKQAVARLKGEDEDDG